jgi:hypothetical protein
MKRLLLAAAVAALPAFAGSVMADTINFDSNGATGGAAFTAITGLDVLPGNSLAQGAIPTATNPAVTNYNQYFQGVINAALLSGGGSTTITNAAQEFTIVLGYHGTASSIPVVPGLVSLGLQNTTGSYFEIWYDTTPDSSALNGTGFRDGTLVMSGTISGATGNFQVDVPPAPQPFDQSGANNYGTELTVTGRGTLTVKATIASYDHSFFQGIPDSLQIAFATGNTTTDLPFTNADPSRQYETPGGTVVPSYVGHEADVVPYVNGLTPGDLAAETDANVFFSVAPTPDVASAGGLLMGLVGMMGLGRRRRNA